MRKDYSDLIEQPDAAEALSWLQEADDPDERSISGGDGSDTAWFGEYGLQLVRELYALGAVRVTAVEIEGRVEGAEQQDTSTLVVELPGDAAKRVCLFAWGAGFARGSGWDPTLDTGQKHLLVWRD